MKLVGWATLIALCGCGWQPAGSSIPVPTAPIAITLHVGQRTTVTLPARQLGETRSATSTAPLVATAAIDSQGNLAITGVSVGDATVTQTDAAGSNTIRRTYDVQVIP